MCSRENRRKIAGFAAALMHEFTDATHFSLLHSTFHPTVAKLKKFLEINSTSTDKEGKSWKSIDSNYNRLWFQFHWVSALRLNLLLRHKGSVSSFDWHFFPLDRALSSEFVSLSHVVSWVLLKFDGAWSSQFQTFTAFFFATLNFNSESGVCCSRADWLLRIGNECT